MVQVWPCCPRWVKCILSMFHSCWSSRQLQMEVNQGVWLWSKRSLSNTLAPILFFNYGHSQWVTVSDWLPLWFKDNAIFTWIWHTCVFSMFHDNDLPLRQLHTLNSGAPNRPISAWWSRRGCSQGDLTLIMVQRAHHFISQLIESQVPGLETVTSFSQ